jgi:DNA-binding response OmpR family regulator
MNALARLLCIEPAANPQTSLRSDLEKRGYYVSVLFNDRAALKRIETDDIQLVIVNALAARSLGEETCRTLRWRGVDLPILLLLPEGDKAAAASQADIVLVKPFTIRKVINRIKKLIAEPSAHILQVGDVQLNCRTRLARRGKGPPQKLTPKQAKLLETLMRRAGQVLTRRFLMKQVWQTDYMGDTRTLDVHIRWVREKIEPNPSKPIYLTTKRRVGYRFAALERKAPDHKADRD